MMQLSLYKKEQYLSRFRAILNLLAPLSDETWLLFSKLIAFKTFGKGERILMAGDLTQEVYFLCEGAVIVSFLDPKGKKYIKNLLFENDFPAATAAVLLRAPSNLNIEAIEDCTLIRVNFWSLKELAKERSDLYEVYVSYLEQKWVIEKDIREIEMATQSAEERYMALLEKYPGIEGRISLHYIAAHLGITPTQLSRVRKDISRS